MTERADAGRDRWKDGWTTVCISMAGFPLQFLSRALSFAVTGMAKKQSDPVPRGDDGETSRAVTTTAAEWPPIVFSLAGHFGTDVDSLQRHYVVELYSSGLDSTAKEVTREPFLSGGDETGHSKIR